MPRLHWYHSIFFFTMVILLHRCSSAFRAARPIRKSNSLSYDRLEMIRRRCFASPPSEDPISTEARTKHTPPWNDPRLIGMIQERKKKDNARFRQHVNPLSRQYQLPTNLPPEWPASAFTDLSLPLHLDIGCSKGGYLLDLSREETPGQFNYLGLEIRPTVATYAQQRIARHSHAQGRVDFLGCNANVDLERLVRTYCSSGGDRGPLQRVTIQFPDPHFKNQHQKRRVVSKELVATLVTLMPEKAEIFLQSDVQGVLDDMRERFRANECFDDAVSSATDYYPHNIYGVATEREISVLVKDLPVYRALFRRNNRDSENEEASEK